MPHIDVIVDLETPTEPCESEQGCYTAASQRELGGRLLCTAVEGSGLRVVTYSPMVIYGLVLQAVKLRRTDDLLITFVDERGHKTVISVSPGGEFSCMPRSFIDDAFVVLGDIHRAADDTKTWRRVELTNPEYQLIKHMSHVELRRFCKTLEPERVTQSHETPLETESVSRVDVRDPINEQPNFRLYSMTSVGTAVVGHALYF